MKRIILGVLAMLVVLPALELGSGVLGEPSAMAVGGLAMLHHVALGAGTSTSAFANALQVSTASCWRGFKLHRAHWLAGRGLMGIPPPAALGLSDLTVTLPFSCSLLSSQPTPPSALTQKGESAPPPPIALPRHHSPLHRAQTLLSRTPSTHPSTRPSRVT
jgi:hypothetical protein